ncbi:MAG TPA: hypothetical protein VFT69_19005 [Pseudolabrys sp.]|jgi:hypothetical protein|nr:hypothetical protein [Pseudolabrys sp.]
MLRYLGLIGLPLLLLATPASAATTKQKMETCKFGAESEHLTGAKRNTFIKRCMAKGDYEPAARKAAMKKHPPKKKSATKKPAAKTSATPTPAAPKPQ